MDARAIRSRFSRLGWWPRVRRLCTRSASLMTSTRRSIEAARIILRNVSRLGVVAPLGPVELGDPVDEDRDLGAELRLHLADGQAGVLHRVVQQRGHQRGGVHPDVREQDRHRERVGDVGRAGLADLPAVPVVGDGVGVAQQARVGAGEDPPVRGDQRAAPRPPCPPLSPPWERRPASAASRRATATPARPIVATRCSPAATDISRLRRAQAPSVTPVVNRDHLSRA